MKCENACNKLIKGTLIFTSDETKYASDCGCAVYVDEFILRKNERCEFIPPFTYNYFCSIVKHGYLHQNITMFTKIYSTCVLHSMYKHEN